MVAGNTKKIIIIKNISSNLIEEAILILRNEPGGQGMNSPGKAANSKVNVRNDFILREAESIINRYIKENGLTTVAKRDRYACSQLGEKKTLHINISVNTIINILLVLSIAFLLWVTLKLM